MKNSVNSCYSVVIPAYQASAFIGEAIDSALSQTVPPSAIIVVDDGSTDSTASVALAKGPLVSVVSQCNQGPGAATSAGIINCTTPIVATLDADDIWKKNKMERQLNVLLSHEAKPDLVFCKLSPFGVVQRKSIDPEKSGFLRSTLVMRRDVIEKVGPIKDFDHGFAEFVDWLSRARARGLRLHVVDEILAKRRIHENSMSFNAGNERTLDFLEAAKAALVRKRQTS